MKELWGKESLPVGLEHVCMLPAILQNSLLNLSGLCLTASWHQQLPDSVQ